MSEPLIVIGNGMAAARLVEELAKRALGRYAVAVIGDEPRLAYNRVLLSALLAEEVGFADIELKPARWWRDRGVTLRYGVRASAVDPTAREVTLSNGTRLSFSKLVFATGSQPIKLAIPGMDLPGVLTFRDIDDVNTIAKAACARVVVIGGGLLGLEAAYGLAKARAHVTVLHLMDRLMERQLDARAARMLKRAVEAKGIAVRLEAETARIIGNGRVEAVELRDGSAIPASASTRSWSSLLAVSSARCCSAIPRTVPGISTSFARDRRSSACVTTSCSGAISQPAWRREHERALTSPADRAHDLPLLRRGLRRLGAAGRIRRRCDHGRSRPSRQFRPHLLQGLRTRRDARVGRTSALSHVAAGGRQPCARRLAGRSRPGRGGLPTRRRAPRQRCGRLLSLRPTSDRGLLRRQQADERIHRLGERGHQFAPVHGLLGCRPQTRLRRPHRARQLRSPRPGRPSRPRRL